MTAFQSPGLRYLAAADVIAAMPPVEERLALAETTMTALVADAELPPKIGVHPRPDTSFAHAMPAHLRDPDGAGANDLLGMKWIAGFPANRRRGLPAIHGLVILNDPTTGVPTAILDAGPITAQRTAAISGVAIRQLGPRGAGASAGVALLGAGVQGRSHLDVLGAVLPGCHLTIFDRHPERAEDLARTASTLVGIGAATTAQTARDATVGAAVVLTAASFADPSRRQTLTPDWLEPDALVVAIDYATYVSAAVAREATSFVVDDRGQFLANRDAGQFDGYPDPDLTLGEAITSGTGRPASGRVLVTHLGVGLADVVFGAAILRRAEELGVGTELPR